MTEENSPDQLEARSSALMERHNSYALMYEGGGVLDSWENKLVRTRAKRWLRGLIASRILPTPDQVGGEVQVVSASANKGEFEKHLKKRLGKGYRVWAGDIAKIERVEGSQAKSVQLDASFLPFRDESVHVLIDFLGALWHEAYADERAGKRGEKTTNLETIIDHYRKKISPGGVLIVDASGSRTDKATMVRVREVLGTEELPGFEPPDKIVGDQLYVYRKRD
jgi:ribosomal protein L21